MPVDCDEKESNLICMKISVGIEWIYQRLHEYEGFKKNVKRLFGYRPSPMIESEAMSSLFSTFGQSRGNSTVTIVPLFSSL